MVRFMKLSLKMVKDILEVQFKHYVIDLVLINKHIDLKNNVKTLEGPRRLNYLKSMGLRIVKFS